MRKRVSGLLLAVLTLLSVLPLQALAAEPEDFAETGSPMIEYSTDSSRMPVREGELSDVYGQVDSSAANEIDSMFSDEARAQLAADADRILSFEPIADADAAPVLTKVEHFLSSGGVAAYLQSGKLLQGAEIGLTDNRDDKVQVLVPQGSAKRAETAAILMRFLENGKEG